MADSFTRTAPSSTSGKSEDESKEEYDEELDFTSPKFNPLRVLQSEKVSVPFPNAEVFSSVGGFQEQPLLVQHRQPPSSSSLSPQLPRSQQRNSHQPLPSFSGSSAEFKPRETTFERRLRRKRQEWRKEKEFRLQQQRGESGPSSAEHFLSQREEITAVSEAPSAPTSVKKRNRNIFTRMKQMTGPLSFLTRCMEQKLHVRVTIRGAVTVRSICRGYIVAFDKHLNMAMIDIDEIYRRPAILGKVKSKRGDKLRAAQETLQSENQHMKSVLKEKQKASKETAGNTANTCTVKSGDLKGSLPQVKMDEASCGTLSSVSKTREPGQSEAVGKDTGNILPLQKTCGESSGDRSRDSSLNRPEAGTISLPRHSKKLLTSVYKGVSLPRSPFEREALMLGIADENLQYRHVNQMFIRGENVVTVCLVNFEEG